MAANGLPSLEEIARARQENSTKTEGYTWGVSEDEVMNETY